MEIQVDTSSLKQLESDLATVGRSLDKRTLGPALVDAAQPLLIATQQEAPIGKLPAFKSATIARGPRKGSPRRTTGSYARGGATRRDVRLKAVEGVGDEVVRVLDGVSKRQGKVGWRTHFLKRDFIRDAYVRTIDVVKARFLASVTKTVAKILQRASQ